MSDENRSTPVNRVKPANLDPLPCDRWIARSCFQKSIRRGEADLAVRALANLFLHDPRGVWRHLAIVALEDVGVADISVLQRIVDQKNELRNHRLPGALWKAQVELTHVMAAANHGQTICDLLLRIENDPSLSPEREETIEAGPPAWAESLYDHGAETEKRAIAALCFGGFIDGARSPDPLAVFGIFSEGECADVSRLGQASWNLSRNPMALLLPLVWQSSRKWHAYSIKDDLVQHSEGLGGVPDYALDQFTRVGRSVSRALIASDAELRSILAASGMSSFKWSRAVDDLIFLLEGGLCVRRATWAEGEALRNPARWLPSAAILGQALHPAMMHLTSKRRQLIELRQQLFQRARTTSA